MPPFRPRAVVGMVHLEPLPGTPRAARPLREVVDLAVRDAKALEAGGADAVLVENYGDAPYGKRLAPEQVSALTLAAEAVVRAVPLPVGVNALRNDAPAAIAIAHNTDAAFVRCNVWSGAAWTDQGLVEGCAREALELRRRLGAQVLVLADAHVKHATHPSTLEQAVADNERNLCDAHVLTGERTGAPADPRALERARALASRPVFVGSGLTPQNLASYRLADGFIVGTAMKRQGRVEAKLVEQTVAARDALLP